MTEKQHVIILARGQTMLESVVSDLTTFCLGLAFMGIGIVLGSSALQWVGAIVFFVTSLAKASGMAERKTPEQAMEYIKKIMEEENDNGHS